MSKGAPSVARSGFAGQETSYNRVFATLRIDECGQDASQTLESLCDRWRIWDILPGHIKSPYTQ